MTDTEFCADCELEFGKWPDYAIDNHLWEMLSPSGGYEGLLCLNCMALRYQQKYGEFGAEGPGIPLVVHIGGVTHDQHHQDG